MAYRYRVETIKAACGDGRHARKINLKDEEHARRNQHGGIAVSSGFEFVCMDHNGKIILKLTLTDANGTIQYLAYLSIVKITHASFVTI